MKNPKRKIFEKVKKGNNLEHILNTSSNLLGFCLIILTSLKITNVNNLTKIDELTGFACVLLAASTLLSFISIRSDKEYISVISEKFADIIFFISILIILMITFIIAFSLVF